MGLGYPAYVGVVICIVLLCVVSICGVIWFVVTRMRDQERMRDHEHWRQQKQEADGRSKMVSKGGPNSPQTPGRPSQPKPFAAGLGKREQEHINARNVVDVSPSSNENDEVSFGENGEDIVGYEDKEDVNKNSAVGVELFAKVKHTFKPQNEDTDLQLKKGQIVRILDADPASPHWFRGELDGRVGMVPRSYVTDPVDFDSLP
jgi:hypothetical protein